MRPDKTTEIDVLPKYVDGQTATNGREKDIVARRAKRFHSEHTRRIDIRALEGLRKYIASTGGSPWNNEEMVYQLWYLTEFAHTILTALQEQQRAIDDLRVKGNPNDREKLFLDRAILTHPGEPINHPPDWPPF